MTAATAVKTALLAATATSNDKGQTKADSLKRCAETLTKAVTALKSTFQAFSKLEPVLADASLAALEHAQQFRDARPANRLVQSVMEIGKATNRANQAKMLRAEMVSWFVANSPIYWDTDGNVHVRKEGEKGYKGFNREEAAKTSFYERPQAKAAREQAERAQANALAVITPTVALNRLKGMLTWFERAAAEVDATTNKPRVIVKADKIKSAIKAAIAAAEDTFTAKDLATEAPSDEKQVRKNMRAVKSTLIRKGSRKHRQATARTKSAAKANGATAQAAL